MSHRPRGTGSRRPRPTGPRRSPAVSPAAPRRGAGTPRPGWAAPRLPSRAAPSWRLLEHEGHVVGVAVRPVLAGLDRRHDRMTTRTDVLGGVAIGRGVAAADVAAGAAHPKVDPRGADRQAILAAGDALG